MNGLRLVLVFSLGIMISMVNTGCATGGGSGPEPYVFTRVHKKISKDGDFEKERKKYIEMRYEKFKVNMTYNLFYPLFSKFEVGKKKYDQELLSQYYEESGNQKFAQLEKQNLGFFGVVSGYILMPLAGMLFYSMILSPTHDPTDTVGYASTVAVFWLIQQAFPLSHINRASFFNAELKKSISKEYFAQ